MFISLTTKYLKIMVHYEWTDDIVRPKSLAGGKINQPGQLAPHPLDKGNQTVRWT